MTIADLLALRDALAAQSSSSSTSTAAKSTTSATVNDSATTASNATHTFGGAIARLPKASQAQTQTTTTGTSDQKFLSRLLTSWTNTFFTAISLGFQTTDFISALKKGLEPLFPVLSATNTNSTDPNSNSSDPNSNSTDPNSNSSDPNTGGIENISAPSGNTDGSGSSTL